jgi:hypothetical protein
LVEPRQERPRSVYFRDGVIQTATTGTLAGTAPVAWAISNDHDTKPESRI